MIVERYGITLRSVLADDLELVREWRNAEHVRTRMIYTAPITEEQHRLWFETISNDRNFYFIFSYSGEPAGIVNLKDTDWKAGMAEAGIFTGNKDYLQSTVPYLAVLALMDLAFKVFKLKKLRARVTIDNSSAIAFNKSLGYIPVKEEAVGETYFLYEVSREQYDTATASVRWAAERLSGNKMIIEPEAQKEILSRLGLTVTDRIELEI